MSRTKDFPITLAFPPQGHFTQPHLAIPCLKAWIEHEGFQDVEQLDLSIEAYDHFLSRPALEAARERVSGRLQLSRFSGRDALAFGDLGAYRAAAESAVAAEALIASVEDAKGVLRSEAFYDMDAYVPAARTLYHGLRLISAAYSPSELTPHNFTMAYANDRSADVLAALVDREQNPFIAFYEEQVLPRLEQRRPRVLGLSVLYGSQLIPALTLGRLVKRALPDCHVTAGGGFLAYIGSKLMRAPGIDCALDSIIFHEGEAPLAALCTALQQGRSLASVGSLTWFERAFDPDDMRGGAQAVQNPPAHPIRLDEAPAPSLDGLPLGKYLSPRLVVPYDINRGCYYGECTFCTLPTVIGPGYRTRKATTIARHVHELKERYATSNFNFITDCMPPGMIRDLPEELIRTEADITWWSDARIEPKAYTEEGARRLYEAGCRKLLFGFETATPRLLKMMKKGQSLKSVVEVATNCTAADISVTFYAMVGFPSETKEEARATLDFIAEHRDVVREVSLQTFHIDEVAETYRNPEAFGITVLEDPEADLQLYHDYRSTSGMTQEEAAEVFEELMESFRANLPIFSGDNVFYFMQKSHYFLHLARGTRPAEFAAACAQRTAARGERGADPELRVRSTFNALEVPFSYTQALAKLAHPLARAARPEFLTGRYVRDAAEEAERRLGTLAPEKVVLGYDGAQAEFVELRPDGLRVLEALERAGTLGKLVDSIDPALPESAAARANLERFARDLHRLGVLTPV